jgi:hypothetical protein
MDQIALKTIARCEGDYGFTAIHLARPYCGWIVHAEIISAAGLPYTSRFVRFPESAFHWAVGNMLGEPASNHLVLKTRETFHPLILILILGLDGYLPAAYILELS